MRRKKEEVAKESPKEEEARPVKVRYNHTPLSSVASRLFSGEKDSLWTTALLRHGKVKNKIEVFIDLPDTANKINLEVFLDEET